MSDPRVCWCKEIDASAIVRAVKAGARTLQAVREATGACTGDRCAESNPKGRCCSPDILAIIERASGSAPRPGRGRRD